MNLNELLENHPLSIEALRGWVLQEMLKSSDVDLDIVPADFIKAVTANAMSNQNLLETMLTAPRLYFTFFDLNKLFINVVYSDGFFVSDIFGLPGNSVKYTERKDAELNSLQQAFDILEKDLEEKVNAKIDSEIKTE